ncbi:membrane hypothetical protein [Gammaproteobacteria bacterium]
MIGGAHRNVLSGVGALLARYRYAAVAVDQILLSLFAFVLNVVLLKVLSTTDYGIVTLWVSISLFTIGVQNALVTTPLSVYVTPAPAGKEKRAMEESLASVNIALVIVMVAIEVLVTRIAGGEWAPRTATATVAIPVFIAANLSREYYRGITFSRRDVSTLLLNDGGYLVATAGGLTVMIMWPQRFGGWVDAFIMMTVGCVLGALCIHGRLERRMLFPSGWFHSYRSIMGEVGWSFVGVLANHAQARSYVYLVTAFADLNALAAIAGVGMLFRPVNLLATAWERSARPDLATDFAHGKYDVFDRTIFKAVLAAMVGSLVWYLVLLAGWSVVERQVLAGKYPEAGRLLLPWVVTTSISLVRYVIGIGLQAAREFRFLAHAQIFGGIASLAAVVIVLLWRDYTWTLWGIAVGEACCLTLLLIRLRTMPKKLIRE